jgi:protein phosphatase
VRARHGRSAKASALAGAGAGGRGRGLEVAPLLDRQRHRMQHVDHYVDAYRRYVRPVTGVPDLRLAPFHVLAAETGVFIDRDHTWHLVLALESEPLDPRL